MKFCNKQQQNYYNKRERERKKERIGTPRLNLEEDDEREREKNLVEIFLKYTINRLKICLRLDNQRERERKNNGINCLVVVVKRIIIVLKIFFFFYFLSHAWNLSIYTKFIKGKIKNFFFIV